MLKAQQVEQFHEDGFIAYGRVMDDAELEELRGVYDALFRGEIDMGDQRVVNIAQGHREQEERRMLQVINSRRHVPAIDRLARKPAILELVAQLIGVRDVRINHDQALFKPPFHGDIVPWHQDNSYWRCQPATLVSCWLTLDDVDEANGAMRCIPGSHRDVAEHEKGPGGREMLQHVKVDETLAQTVPLPAGGVMFHHCLTLHATNANRTARPRRAIAFHYMAPDTCDAKGATIPSEPLW